MNFFGLPVASFWRDERGAVGAEYALILAIVTATVVGAIIFLGTSLAGTLSVAAGCVETGCV